jgi:pSer/pThr/pTyr-binding forkhead associated (FHA) protein
MGDERLTFERLLDAFRRGGSLPDSPLLVSASPQHTPEDGTPLAHQTLGRGTPSAELGPSAVDGDATVHVVEKTKRNPFADMITVGRASNNDIVIADSEVSKFHAYFKRVSELRLFDAGSTNGTKIDGRGVGKEGSPIPTLARISFGPGREYVFVNREDVKSWLEAQAGALSPTKRVPPRTVRIGDRKAVEDFAPDPEVAGSLATEPLERVLRRAERERWSGTLDIQIGDHQIELSLTAGAIAAFWSRGRPGARADLARALEADTGLFRFRRGASGSPPIGAPLGPVSKVLDDIG